MKVIIDGVPNTFISIFRPGIGANNRGTLAASKTHWQCNTEGNKSAHNFKQHPKHYEKDIQLRTNGHTYIFPS
jgi:hypothetical protein